MPELQLTGCGSQPLVGYLKGLGVLRVVSRQVDGEARGRWRTGVFELASELDRGALERLFADEYAPSPVVSPWNGGSGFFPKDRQEPIRAIEQSTTSRLAPYRAAIGSARDGLEHEGLTDKPAPSAKPALVRRLRRTLPDEAIDWLDAAVVVRTDGLSYPPLLGSGGNDGRFDFSNNYARSVVECILEPNRDSARQNLSAALWGAPARLDRKLSLAHFSRDSSPNNSPYGEADSLGNPWDLMLAVEGSLTLASGATRRHGSELPGILSAPFTVNPTSAGFGSAVEGESGRAELWLPLWSGWAKLPELIALAREARAQVGGTRRRQAATGLDFARAAGELGVARGIDAFERYSILERAGQSNLAVPVGRVAVEERKAAEALRGIDAWLASAIRFVEWGECPQGPRAAIRRLEKSAFELASRGGATSGCAALEAIGDVEAALARSSASAQRMRPLRGVPAAPWVQAADDGSPEFAIAVAIASLRESDRHRGNQGDPRGPLPTVRDYLHGTVTGPKGEVAFDPSRSRAISGQDPYGLLAGLHARRHLEAARAGGTPQPARAASKTESDSAVPRSTTLSFTHATPAPLDAARLFAAGALDPQRVLALLRGLAVLDFDRAKVELARRKPAGSRPAPVPGFELLALAWQAPGSRRRDPRVARGGNSAELGARPGWAAQLAAGAVPAVLDAALLRLRMAGLPPAVGAADMAPASRADRELGRGLAAALLLQLEPCDLRDLVDAYIVPEKENKDEKEAS